MIAPDRSYDALRFHRGSRGFAAFVTGLNGLLVLGASVFVIPALALDGVVASWAVLLGLVAGVGHLVAAVGLIRGRRWAASLVGYLATAGIAVAAFGALLAVIGLDVLGSDRGTVAGFLAWMIGAWVVAARFAFKPFTFIPRSDRLAPGVAAPAGAPLATPALPEATVRPARLLPPAPIGRPARPVGAL